MRMHCNKRHQNKLPSCRKVRKRAWVGLQIPPLKEAILSTAMTVSTATIARHGCTLCADPLKKAASPCLTQGQDTASQLLKIRCCRMQNRLRLPTPTPSSARIQRLIPLSASQAHLAPEALVAISFTNHTARTQMSMSQRRVMPPYGLICSCLRRRASAPPVACASIVSGQAIHPPEPRRTTPVWMRQITPVLLTQPPTCRTSLHRSLQCSPLHALDSEKCYRQH